MKKIYRISEVAKILNLSKRTIVRYEKRGIFPSPRRNSVNNWREYTNKDIKKMERILGRL